MVAKLGAAFLCAHLNIQGELKHSEYIANWIVDAQQYGRSLTGLSKIANSIAHEMLFEMVTHDPRKYQIRFCVGPSKENGLLQEIFAVWMSGLPLVTPIVMKIGSIFVEQMIKAMIARTLNKPSEVDKALDDGR